MERKRREQKKTIYMKRKRKRVWTQGNDKRGGGGTERSCHFAANRRKAEAKVTECKVAAVQTDDPFSWD